MQTTALSALNRLNFKHWGRSSGITRIFKQRYNVWRSSSSLSLDLAPALKATPVLVSEDGRLWGSHSLCQKHVVVYVVQRVLNHEKEIREIS